MTSVLEADAATDTTRFRPAPDVVLDLLGECSIGQGGGCVPHHSPAGDRYTCEAFDRAVSVIETDRMAARRAHEALS